MNNFFNLYPDAPCYYKVGKETFYAHQKDRAEMEARTSGLKLEVIKNPDKSVKENEGIGAAVVENKSNEQLQKELAEGAKGKSVETSKPRAKKTTTKKSATTTKSGSSTNNKND